jgi:hypothetical protein
VVEGAGLDNVGDAPVAPSRHGEMDEQADHQAAERRRQHDLPPG